MLLAIFIAMGRFGLDKKALFCLCAVLGLGILLMYVSLFLERERDDNMKVGGAGCYAQSVFFIETVFSHESRYFWYAHKTAI